MRYLTSDKRILNWPEFPLVRIVFYFMLGIVISDSVSNIPLLYSIGLACCILLIVTYIQKKGFHQNSMVNAAGVLIFVGFLVLGFIRNEVQKPVKNTLHYIHHISENNYVTGQLTQAVKLKASSSSTLLNVSGVDGKSANGKLLVYFNKADTTVRNYEIGDVIVLHGSLRDIQSSNNPHAFDYRLHMQRKGIEKQVFLKNGAHDLVRKDEIFFLFHYANYIRESAIESLRKRLPIAEQFATATAMILGERDYIDEDLQAAFSDTGAVHILAVSGLHVGIILMFFQLFFRKVKKESKNAIKLTKASILLLVVIGYTLVTGASPAVVRASLMFSTLMIGQLWFTNTNIYNILSFSALLILVVNPQFLFHLGFLFSYMALISIIFFQPYLMMVVDKYLNPSNIITTRLSQLVTVSIAAQFLIFPSSIYTFHKFPLYFILSGVFAVFMAPFILGVGLILVVLDWIPVIGETIADWLGVVLSMLLWIFLKIIYIIQSLPITTIDNVWISKSTMFAMYAIIFGVMYLLAHKKTSYDFFYNPTNTANKVSLMVILSSLFLISFNLSYFQYRIKNHRELVVYNYRGGTIIDIFDGKDLFTIRSSNIDDKKLKYACLDNRIYWGSPNQNIVGFDMPVSERLFEMRDNGLMVIDQSTLLFASEINVDEPIVESSDVLILSHMTELLPYELLNYHKTKLVVVDNSTTYKIRNQWRAECKKRSIPIQFVNSDEVFKLTF